MAQISSYLRSSSSGDPGGYRWLTYWCQGCEEPHSVCVAKPAHDADYPCWGYNGNPDCPTFTPSVLVRWTGYDPPLQPGEVREKITKVCHTFITDGKVQFLADCTHAFAGQTVPLPELPEHMRSDQWSDGD